MKRIQITAVSRGEKFSPNHISNDAAIFKKVVNELEQKNCIVNTYTEEIFVRDNISDLIIFNMARDGRTLERLKELEDSGALVINSAYGIGNCIRKPMTEKLLENGIPHPESIFINTRQTYQGNFFPCWLKRADSHAIVKEDVAYAADQHQADAILNDFKNRGIAEAVVNKHIQGDLIKFYGVLDSDFFYWFHPDPCSHSKFGLEKINGKAHGYSFDVNQLKEYSNKASRTMNVPIYGGDCVVEPDGRLTIIDFNDGPSFARCREEAGKAIADYIYKQALKQTNHDEGFSK